MAEPKKRKFNKTFVATNPAVCSAPQIQEQPRPKLPPQPALNITTAEDPIQVQPKKRTFNKTLVATNLANRSNPQIQEQARPKLSPQPALNITTAEDPIQVEPKKKCRKYNPLAVADPARLMCSDEKLEDLQPVATLASKETAAAKKTSIQPVAAKTTKLPNIAACSIPGPPPIKYVFGNPIAQAAIVKYLKQEPLSKTMVKPILLISGPPGVGKSTAVEYHLVSHGFRPSIFNLSDTRNLSYLVDTELVKLYKTKACNLSSLSRPGKSAIVLEEFDGFDSRSSEPTSTLTLPDQQEPCGSGLSSLYGLVKDFKHQSRFVPIICVVNELTRSAILGMSKHAHVQHVKFGRLYDSDMMSYFASVIVPKYPHLGSAMYSEQKRLVTISNGDMRQLDNYVAFYMRPMNIAPTDPVQVEPKKTLVDITPELFRDVGDILMPDYANQTITDTETLFTGDPFIHLCMVHENYPALLQPGDVAATTTAPNAMFLALLELISYISKQPTNVLATWIEQISKKVYSATDGGCELLVPEQPEFFKMSFGRKYFVAPVALVRYILERKYIPNPTSQVLIRTCDTKNCLAMKHLAIGDAASNRYPIVCDLKMLPSDNAVTLLASLARALYDDSMLSADWSDNGAFIGYSTLLLSVTSRMLWLANLGLYQPKPRGPKTRPKIPNLEFTKLPGQISKQRRKQLANTVTITMKDTRVELTTKTKRIAPKLLTLKQILEKSKYTSSWREQHFETVLKLKLKNILETLDDMENEDLQEILTIYAPRHTLFIVHTCATMALTKLKLPKWFLELLQNALS